MNLKEELQNRGFVYQFSDEKVFELYDKGGEKLYCGVDPTADSLHLGNFVLFMTAVNFMKKGNKFVLLIGGATGMIGDPGGKDSEREFLEIDKLRHNQQAITKQVTGILNHLKEMTGKEFDFEVVNNYDFYENMGALDYLREIGKYMTVNQMLTKETVKRRIEDPDQSISYTEFSYMLLQGYDFYKLFADKDVKLQIGGQDQWGNLVTGIELIRKKANADAYVMTFPLITDSNGKKFGKSAGNAIWLDPTKNSPYFVYQYFINTSDEYLDKFLKLFTLLEFDEIEGIVKKHMENPAERYGQKLLSRYVIETIFGKQASIQAEKITEILFSEGDKIGLISSLDDEGLKALYNETGGSKGSQEKNLLNILIEIGIAPSKTEGKKLIESGSIYINENKITEINHSINDNDFINGKSILLRKGKKTFKVILK